ncbi:unnamed protein product [Chironomus riparius]|uniref:BTB domain-containing protein n=1 Tax=Chironomus riparius TaxID=315576 RepID=A0A9N9WVS9_9DIPT|nr:unnamed protein product [Chironomus riparius]
MKNSTKIKICASKLKQMCPKTYQMKSKVSWLKTNPSRTSKSPSKVKIHKFLLAARSPILAEILKSNPEVENLNLVEISVEIFEIILKFLYTDELPGDNGTIVLHLFAAAEKLKIEKIKNFAGTKLINTIDQENALNILKLSNKYEHEELRQKSFNKVKKMYPKCDFKDFHKTNFELMMKIIEQFEKYENLFVNWKKNLKL